MPRSAQHVYARRKTGSGWQMHGTPDVGLGEVRDLENREQPQFVLVAVDDGQSSLLLF